MVEHQLPKLSVEGSIPFARSISAIVRPAALIEDLEALARRLRHLDRQGVRCGVEVLLTHDARAMICIWCERAPGARLRECLSHDVFGLAGGGRQLGCLAAAPVLGLRVG